MTSDHDDLKQWIGRTETLVDTLNGIHLSGLSALLDISDELPVDGTPLQPTAHWLFFQPRARQSQLDKDGHPHRGGFLPPVHLPRRMWAGSRIHYTAPLRVGQTVERLSEILDISVKQGAAGTLVFVTVRHTYHGPDGLAVSEDQDIVYREDPKPGAPAAKARPAPTDADWRATMCPDTVMLFRYSALTFNAHRIHYDLPYAQIAEGYPGLVVHGPLTATLLIEELLKQRPDASLESYHYRAMSPLFCGNDVVLAGKAGAENSTSELWAENTEGNLAMQGTATWR